MTAVDVTAAEVTWADVPRIFPTYADLLGGVPTWGELARIVAERMRSRGMTPAHRQAVVADFEVRFAALEQQVNALLAAAADDGPNGLPGPVARYVRAHLLELLTLLVTVSGALIALRGVEQDAAEYARPDPPPSVAVVVVEPPPVVGPPQVIVERGEADRAADEPGTTAAPPDGGSGR